MYMYMYMYMCMCMYMYIDLTKFYMPQSCKIIFCNYGNTWVAITSVCVRVQRGLPLYTEVLFQAGYWNSGVPLYAVEWGFHRGVLIHFWVLDGGVHK